MFKQTLLNTSKQERIEVKSFTYNNESNTMRHLSYKLNRSEGFTL